MSSATGALKLPAAADRMTAAWLFLGVCAIAAYILLAPFRAAQVPAMADYPNHLARAQIIVDAQLSGREHPYYAVRHALVPNLALDTLVPLGVRAGLSTNDALRLFAALALLMPLAGTIAMGFALQGGVPWLALLALPLGYSRYYAWGFLNYFFSLGLAFLGFALWVLLREGRLRLAAPLLLTAGILALLSHLAGFGVLAILVLCHELGRSRRLTRPLVAAGAVLAVCGLGYLAFFDRQLPLTLAWEEGALIKARNLASPFVAYSVAAGLIVAAGWFATLAWTRRQGALRMEPGWRAPLAVFALLILVLPSMAMNSYFLTARLVIVLPLVFLAYARLEARPRVHAVIAVAALALVALKAAEVRSEWRRFSYDVAHYREAFRTLPPGARVATIVYATRAGIVPARHAAAFAVLDRDAFIPNFYAFPFNGESVAFRDNVRALTARSEKDHLIYGPGEGEPPWALYCAHYDALFVLRLDAAPERPPPCATRSVQSHDFALYRLSPGAVRR